jgi:hypothetical protein
MHKVTYALLKGCFAITSVILILSVLMLVNIKSDTASIGHTLLLVREMCSTGAVVLLLSVVGSAVLHERLG